MLSPKTLFAALLIYLVWYIVNANSPKAGNVYIFLILASSLMYNREKLFTELTALGVI